MNELKTDDFNDGFINISNDEYNIDFDNVFDDLSPFHELTDYYKTKPNHRLNNMRFALLNINSVRAKLDDLYELCKLNLFQIIFIQESKLDPSVSDEHVSFFDYKVFRRDRFSNGGGLLILIKRHLNVINAIIDPVIESIFLKIRFQNGQIINFISTYHPPVNQKIKYEIDE